MKETILKIYEIDNNLLLNVDWKNISIEWNFIKTLFKYYSLDITIVFKSKWTFDTWYNCWKEIILNWKQIKKKFDNNFEILKYSLNKIWLKLNLIIENELKEYILKNDFNYEIEKWLYN